MIAGFWAELLVYMVSTGGAILIVMVGLKDYRSTHNPFERVHPLMDEPTNREY